MMSYYGVIAPDLIESKTGNFSKLESKLCGFKHGVYGGLFGAIFGLSI
jgi:hypothetical protein